MISCLKGKRHDEDEEYNQQFFIKNGGVLLKELVAFSNGKPNPIRHFSEKELFMATNYYDKRQIVLEDTGYQLYKGYLKDRQILVKKYDNDHRVNVSAVDPYKDIAIGSKMSTHKNVLKVLGCCLEAKLPTVVYEYAGTETLSACISRASVEPLPWKCRLKIGVDIANANAYLHTAFHRPIIHRDIRCFNIILDEKNVPKIIDFGLCISIPEGKLHALSAVLGRKWATIYGLGTPEYVAEGIVTEKLDVYFFGLVLVELLIGEKPHSGIMMLIEEERWIEEISNVVDPRITEEGIDAHRLLDFATLLSKCTCKDEEKRPTMIEVAKELRRIHQSF